MVAGGGVSETAVVPFEGAGEGGGGQLVPAGEGGKVWGAGERERAELEEKLMKERAKEDEVMLIQANDAVAKSQVRLQDFDTDLS